MDCKGFLSKWKGLLPDYTWAGLENYKGLFSDSRFHIDIRNTLIFTIIFVVGSLFIGLGSGSLLDQNIKGEGFFRSFTCFQWQFRSL